MAILDRRGRAAKPATAAQAGKRLSAA